MLNIVVLISGSGSNLQAIIDAITTGRLKARITGVLSNKTDAYGLVRAQQAGIVTATLSHTTYATRDDFDKAMMTQIDAWAPDVVVLAGFMRILTPAFAEHTKGACLTFTLLCFLVIKACILIVEPWKKATRSMGVQCIL